MSDQLAVKATLTGADGVDVMRKFFLPRSVRGDGMAQLSAIAVERFGLAKGAALEWQHWDEDDDLVTFTRDEELDEILSTLPLSSNVIYFKFRALADRSGPSRRESHNLSDATSASLGDGDRSVPPQVQERFQTTATGQASMLLDQKDGDADLMAWSTVEFEECSSDDGSCDSSPSIGDKANDDDVEDSVHTAFSAGHTEFDPVLLDEPAAAEDPVEEAANDDPAEAPLPSSISSADPDPEEPTLPTLPTLPPSLASFISTLPSRADRLSNQVTSLFEQDRLSSIFTSAARTAQHTSLDDVPTLVRGVTGEVGSLVGDLFQGFRREADSLRSDFETFKREMEKERENLQERFSELRTSAPDPVATSTSNSTSMESEYEEVSRDVATAATGSDQAPTEMVIEKSEGVQTLSDEQFEAGLRRVDADVESAQNEWAAEKDLDLEEANESVRIERLKRMKKQYEKEKEALQEARKAAKENKKAAKGAKRSAKKLARFEAKSHPLTTAPAPEVSPFDDVHVAQDEKPTDPIPQPPTFIDRPHRRIYNNNGKSRATSSIATLDDEQTLPTPSAPESSQPHTIPSDDFFRRRISSGGFMSGAYYRPVAGLSTLSSFAPPVPPVPTAAPTVAPRTFAEVAESSALRMPGAFDVEHHAPSPRPVASTSGTRIEPVWAEVTPSQLAKAIKELGFDTKDLGISIAVERAWTETRGKPLAEMVTAVLEQVLV